MKRRLPKIADVHRGKEAREKEWVMAANPNLIPV
jgi:hypothetical protein